MKTAKIIFSVLIVYATIFALTGNIVGKKFSYKKDFSPNGADAIVVFFGGFENSGELNRESMRRLNFSLELYRNGGGRNIIFVGGRRRALDLKGSELSAQIAEKKGIHRKNIFFDTESNDTAGNLREAGKIIEKNKFMNIIYISSSFHLMRISLLAKDMDTPPCHFASYDENTTIPIKSFTEKIIDFNYNVISHILYSVLPEGYYERLIRYLR